MCENPLLLAGVKVCVCVHACILLAMKQKGTHVEQEALAAADGLSKQMQVRVRGLS